MYTTPAIYLRNNYYRSIYNESLMLSPNCTRKTEKSKASFHSFFFFSFFFLFFSSFFIYSYLWIDEIIIIIGKRYKGREYHNNYRNITKKYSASKKLNNVALGESRSTDSKYLIKWNIFCGRKRRFEFCIQ